VKRIKGVDMMTPEQKMMLTFERMQPYDGDGWLCNIADGNGGNMGYGDTPSDALNSWERGDDIGKDAMRKWKSKGLM
jgi:hypothetical protein